MTDPTMKKMKEAKETNPAYGMACFSRVTCSGGMILYGSSVEPSNYMTLSIMRGEREHGLGKTWYRGTEELIEVSFSPAQFAELITTLNVGDGVPCTISRHNGKLVPRLRDEQNISETKRVVEEVRQLGATFAQPLTTFKSKIDGLVTDKKLSQKMAKEITDHFYRMEQDLRSNIPFYVSQVDEAAASVVAEKKAEIDAFATHIITSLGREALQNLKLENNNLSQEGIAYGIDK